MSNFLAIATVTATLSQIMQESANEVMSGVSVTTMRPESVGNDPDPGINIFLYHVLPNPTLRNFDLPTRDSDGNPIARPQAALNLHYLLTFYGNEVDLEPQRLMGNAVSFLHAQPVLTSETIRAALEARTGGSADHYLYGSDLAQQVEQIKFVPLSVNLEELSKLWSIFFQIPYSLSLAYKASVVLIERELAVRKPLPVLRRGEDDGGVQVRADVTPPFPSIDAVQPPKSQLGAMLGDTVTIKGHSLDGDSVVVSFHHPRLKDPIVVPAAASAVNENEIEATIPDKPAEIPAGIYTVAVTVNAAGGRSHTSNKLPLVLAPKITNVPLSVPADGSGGLELDLTCSPEVRPAQSVSVVLGDRQVTAEPFESQTGSLKFVVKKAQKGEHYVRLRVDGVESELVDRGKTPPEFRATQKVTIT
jgi:hypothetical protein